jgi:hypothetical protein
MKELLVAMGAGALMLFLFCAGIVVGYKQSARDTLAHMERMERGDL